MLLKLLNIFLIGHANSALVITLLMRVQPNLMVEGLLDMYAKDPTSLPRILDVAQETKVCYEFENGVLDTHQVK